MGAGGSIPADEAAAKEAGRTDDEIALYKFCVGLQDGSTKDVSAEGCEFGPPGAPPLPIDAMLGICKNMVGALPDWKSLCLGIEKNEDGTYTVLTQQVCGAMKADLPAVEGTPFPEVKLDELPDSAKVEMVFPVEVMKYTLEGDRIKKAGSTGETKPPAEVEGANADVTPYLQEQWDAGKGGFGAIYSMLGKPLPEAPAEEAAAAPAEEPAADAAPAAE